MTNDYKAVKLELLGFYAEIGWLDILEMEVYQSMLASYKTLENIKHKPKPIKKARSTIDLKAIGQPKTNVNFEATKDTPKKQKSMNIDIHDIAKMLTKVIPVEFTQAEFKKLVDTVEKKIKRMPANQRMILKAAYIFSTKVPNKEREDMFQYLTLKLLEANPQAENWAYTIARCDWLDWYRKYKIKSQYSEYDIESIVSDEIGINEIHLHELEAKSDDMRELADDARANQYNKRSYQVAVESLTGLIEYERLDNQLTAKSIIEQLPDNIKLIANKRMIGNALLAKERQALCRFIKANPDMVSQFRTL